MCANHATQHEHGWGQLGYGIHACSIFRDTDEQFSQIAPFFAEGFKKHEKCIYVFDENAPADIAARIRAPETSPEAFGAPADLELLSKNELYTNDGTFEGDDVISLMDDMIAASLEQGYSGVRASAEMSWALTNGTSAEKLIKYEENLNELYPSRKLTGVCQYDETKFTPQFLIEMIRTHPYLIVRGRVYENKYFYIDPEYAIDSPKRFKSANYETILSIIMEDQPIM